MNRKSGITGIGDFLVVLCEEDESGNGGGWRIQGFRPSVIWELGLWFYGFGPEETTYWAYLLQTCALHVNTHNFEKIKEMSFAP